MSLCFRAVRLGVLMGLIAAWLGLGLALARENTAVSASDIAHKLDAVKDDVAAEVTAALKTNVIRANYTVVWREFEDVAIHALCDTLPRLIPELTATNFNRGTAGREKNRLADLAIQVGGQEIEVSIKAARRSANPENDLGTFREYPNRKRLFPDSFTLWVRYDDSGSNTVCDRVFFDRTWRFVGKSTLVDGVKYRKKDGNMRPKPWAMFDSGKAYWQTEEEFEAAMQRSETYRANELIKEHLQNLSEEDQQLLFELLKKKFESPAAKQR